MALAAILGTLPGASPARAENPAPATAAQPASTTHDASLAEYRQHLVDLGAIVDACAKARDTKSCDPVLVGQDDHVPLSNAPNAERRLVSYAWLRALLLQAKQKDKPQSTSKEKPQSTAPDKAQDKTQDKAEDASSDDDEDTSDDAAQNTPTNKPPDKPQDKPVSGPATGVKQTQPDEPARPPKPTTSQLLEAAQARLTRDIAQADAAAAAQPAPPADHNSQREAMKQVLAGRDFRNLEPHSVSDSLWEKFGEWLNRFWARAGKLTDQAAWVGRLLVWGFILAICVGLVWGLIQLERRWRIRLVPDTDAPAPGAASARDWQLWLNDARSSAAAGEWRAAVHFVYWAAISRLESKRLWPADRARTPREYLALVVAEDPRRAGLATLTGSFERTWYGGRAAAESDYLKAEELASGLIAGSGGAGADAAKGGAR
jgi:chemotaxis protein histidine kinase CheA